MDLENKTLSQLFELRSLLAGTNCFFVVDRQLKVITSSPYYKMIRHCQKRDKSHFKKFKRF